MRSSNWRSWAKQSSKTSQPLRVKSRKLITNGSSAARSISGMPPLNAIWLKWRDWSCRRMVPIRRIVWNSDSAKNPNSVYSSSEARSFAASGPTSIWSSSISQIQTTRDTPYKPKKTSSEIYLFNLLRFHSDILYLVAVHKASTIEHLEILLKCPKLNW